MKKTSLQTLAKKNEKPGFLRDYYPRRQTSVIKVIY